MNLIPKRESWMADAICAQTDPEEFFPDKGGSTAAAKRTCLGCSARAECLQYAIENNERWGVWGGKSERERSKLMKTAAAQVAA